MFATTGHRMATIAFGLAAVVCCCLQVQAFAQGPSSRPRISGPATQREITRMDATGTPYAVSEDTTSKVPIPDLFRMEAPFVERNLRLDYIHTNHLQEPPADESQFFAEISYSFSERFGVAFASPYLIRDNFEDENTSGFGDIEAGARYVAIGYDEDAPFKMAFGFNVVAPTGDSDRDLGEGVTFLEPEILMFEKLTQYTFAQSQFTLGIPTNSGNTTEFVYNFGLGHVYTDFCHTRWFAYPTTTFEINGFTGVGGLDAGTTIIDVTPGLRWSVGSKAFAGLGVSVPVTGPKEFETQFIFSFVYLYGAEAPSGEGPAPTSRAYF